MNQSDFDAATKGSGAKYYPYTGTDPHWELVGIGVVWGTDKLDFIKVSVQDEFGIMVRHDFGTEYEHFQYVGDPVQFNLGGGSHYNVPDDPPDHISCEGLPSDSVHVGNANIIGFAHTEWQMVFRRSTVTPPVPPTPPSGDYLTRAEFETYKQAVRAANAATITSTTNTSS